MMTSRNIEMMNKNKRAFSMIELVFAILILGIVSSLGSSLIVKTFESYIVQRAVHKASVATELAVTQIVNRITFRIPRTTVARNPSAPFDFLPVSSISSNGDTIHVALEWYAYDNDSFSATKIPGWSAYADTISPNSTMAQFETPGSDLNTTDTIINNLSGGRVDLTGGGAVRPAIFFRAVDSKYDDANTFIHQYQPSCMGLDYAAFDNNCVLAVSGIHSNAAHDIFNFTDATRSGESKYIYEHYKFAWSAYAVVPEQETDFDNTNPLYQLKLYYNYQPWLGNKYTDNSTSSSVLLRNVSVFKFSESGGTMRIKLCVQENIGETDNVTICKEKAVIR